jgi:hypothetical protein
MENRYLPILHTYTQLAAANEKIKTIETRAGITMRPLLNTPEGPAKGALVMFPGGWGANHFEDKEDSSRKELLSPLIPGICKKRIRNCYCRLLVSKISERFSGPVDFIAFLDSDTLFEKPGSPPRRRER